MRSSSIVKPINEDEASTAHIAEADAEAARGAHQRAVGIDPLRPLDRGDYATEVQLLG